MIEVNKEEISKFSEGTQYITYNPFTKKLAVEIASKKDIAHNKYCIPTLKFYVKGE